MTQQEAQVQLIKRTDEMITKVKRQMRALTIVCGIILVAAVALFIVVTKTNHNTVLRTLLGIISGVDLVVFFFLFSRLSPALRGMTYALYKLTRGFDPDFDYIGALEAQEKIK